MDEFNVVEYKPKNPKERTLIDYTFIKLGIPFGSNEFKNEYFSLLSVDDLIESMEYYIEKYGITAKITAQNYISNITTFFEMLAKHGVRNEVFTDIALQKRLISWSKEVISKLKDSDSRDIATAEDQEELTTGLEEYFRTFKIEDVYNEIDNVYNHINVKTVKTVKTEHYNRFLSALAIKLIMYYAISNQVAISIDVSAVNLKEKTLTVNGYILPLSNELVHLLEEYLQVRDFVIKLYSSQEKKLFVKNNGTPFSTRDYSSFLAIMRYLIRNQQADKLASRTILEMCKKGVDIATIAQLSGKSPEKCFQLLQNSRNLNEANRKLLLFYRSDEEIEKKISKKGFLRCPFCGRDTKANSDEWVLVQPKENGEKFIACGVCKGASGKITL